MITPISRIYETAKPPFMEFGANTLVLTVIKFALASFAEESANTYDRYCQSPGDSAGCFALNVNRQFCHNVVTGIDKIGGIIISAIGIMFVNKASSYIYNQITPIRI